MREENFWVKSDRLKEIENFQLRERVWRREDFQLGAFSVTRIFSWENLELREFPVRRIFS